jgi:hypothetical protein
MSVPIILGSDKTTVSVATGQNEYWPLYASIGNIHNNIRRAHGSGLVLVGFLAIPKGMSLVSFGFTKPDILQLTMSILLTQLSVAFGGNYSIHHYQNFLIPFGLE